MRITAIALAAPLLALGACAGESGPPDLSRGSADSPATMLVDQMVNGVPRASGSQVMSGAAAQPLAAGTARQRPDYGGVMRPMQAAGGQKL
ncbi:MAG: hypothetical protein K2X74_12315 [Acetobacteraceae bacterium]|nr:hypothetical protein [Acetobacteraceae bacterium]